MGGFPDGIPRTYHNKLLMAIQCVLIERVIFNCMSSDKFKGTFYN